MNVFELLKAPNRFYEELMQFRKIASVSSFDYENDFVDSDIEEVANCLCLVVDELGLDYFWRYALKNGSPNAFRELKWAVAHFLATNNCEEKLDAGKMVEMVRKCYNAGIINYNNASMIRSVGWAIGAVELDNSNSWDFDEDFTYEDFVTYKDKFIEIAKSFVQSRKQ